MEFNAQSASFDQRVKIITQILANMRTKKDGTGQAGILLSGDPGVGKTSFIKFFSTLMGFEQITIEAPHITEEHIINIPFIVFNPANNTEKREVEHLDDSDYKIVLADSNLFSKIKGLKKLPDDQYLKTIYNGPKDLISIFEEFDGSEKEIPDDFKQVREHFDTILFLDEYFRQSSTRIRNMLRGILNGKLGHHDIPENCYVIYASNLNDEGVDTDISLNNDFKEIEFGTPNKEDWFSWLVNKYSNDKRYNKNPIKKEVIEKFHKMLDEEHLNNNDVDAEVRTSPRRWEQLITYINASIPPKDQKDAKGLMTNVKLNFKNYLTGAHSSLYNKVLKAVEELIEETSDFRQTADDTHDDTDWRTTLEHQIQQKMKLGGTRTYVPIVSGMPGIGKTSEAARVATDLDLRYIYIECSKLDAEDVTGIPLSKKGKGKGDNIETDFSEPKLYLEIMKDAEEADKHYLTTEKGKAMGAAEYKKKEWKYLIFFDEFNRVKPNVFNALRQVILEKKFGGSNYKLPEGSIVIGAINPKDHGAIPLTQHMSDVVDVIDAKASWANTKTYIKDKLMPKIKGVDDKIKESLYNFVVAFADKFKNKSGDPKTRQFYLDIGNQDIYMSPREYSDWFSNSAEHFQMTLKRKLKKLDPSNYTQEDMTKLDHDLKEVVFDSFKSTMSFVLKKQGADSPEFLGDVKNWIMHSDAVNFGEGIFYTKAKTEQLGDVLQKYFDDQSKNLADEPQFMNYMRNNDPHKFKEDLTEFLLSQVEKRFEAEEKIFKHQHKKRELTDDQEHFVDEEVSTMENFIRNMIHAIKLLELSNESKELIKKSIQSVLSQLVKMHKDDEYEEGILTFNARISKYLKSHLTS